VALTFDDGPGPWTSAVLDVLARYGVPATFCLVGEQIPGREAVVARIAEEGHRLCNHTTSHDYALPVRSPAEIRGEIAVTTQRVSSAARDAPVTIFRAPGGRFEPSVLRAAEQAGLTPWAWSVDPQDWRRRDPDAIVAAVLDDIRPGAVVVLHDGGGDRSATVAALESFVPLLQSVGYEFVPLP
jgi:peptidoglycan/xylan/chitin deacetylase (PgdA/CDA1 family)